MELFETQKQNNESKSTQHKDWVGNFNSVFKTLGASNHTDKEREENDFYATDPIAIDVLLREDEGNFKFPTKELLEPSCGQGHLSERLKQYGYNVTSYDLIDRGYGKVKNFFDIKEWNGSIITNPPYILALQFIQYSLSIIPDGQCVAMFLKVQFLEGKERKKLFLENPPKYLFVSSSRITCAKNGEFYDKNGKKISSAVAYAWYVWEKGWKGETVVKWVN